MRVLRLDCRCSFVLTDMPCIAGDYVFRCWRFCYGCVVRSDDGKKMQTRGRRKSSGFYA
jgi:hypothetical protein